jgi:hypothetical protein
VVTHLCLTKTGDGATASVKVAFFKDFGRMKEINCTGKPVARRGHKARDLGACRDLPVASDTLWRPSRQRAAGFCSRSLLARDVSIVASAIQPCSKVEPGSTAIRTGASTQRRL